MFYWSTCKKIIDWLCYFLCAYSNFYYHLLDTQNTIWCWFFYSNHFMKMNIHLFYSNSNYYVTAFACLWWI